VLLSSSYQQEWENDATDEEPFAVFERNDGTVSTLTCSEDGVRPILASQHNDCSIDIGDIDEERLDNEKVEPKISEQHDE
jgi:hypothetical protein